MFRILFAAFLLWCLISPFYPDKPPVALTPEQVEAKRLALESTVRQIEVFNSAVSDIVLPTLLMVCVLVALAIYQRFRLRC